MKRNFYNFIKNKSVLKVALSSVSLFVFGGANWSVYSSDFKPALTEQPEILCAPGLVKQGKSVEYFPLLSEGGKRFYTERVLPDLCAQLNQLLAECDQKEVTPSRLDDALLEMAGRLTRAIYAEVLRFGDYEPVSDAFLMSQMAMNTVVSFQEAVRAQLSAEGRINTLVQFLKTSEEARLQQSSYPFPELLTHPLLECLQERGRVCAEQVGKHILEALPVLFGEEFQENTFKNVLRFFGDLSNQIVSFGLSDMDMITLVDLINPQFASLFVSSSKKDQLKFTGDALKELFVLATKLTFPKEAPEDILQGYHKLSGMGLAALEGFLSDLLKEFQDVRQSPGFGLDSLVAYAQQIVTLLQIQVEESLAMRGPEAKVVGALYSAVINHVQKIMRINDPLKRVFTLFQFLSDSIFSLNQEKEYRKAHSSEFKEVPGALQGAGLGMIPVFYQDAFQPNALEIPTDDQIVQRLFSVPEEAQHVILNFFRQARSWRRHLGQKDTEALKAACRQQAKVWAETILKQSGLPEDQLKRVGEFFDPLLAPIIFQEDGGYDPELIETAIHTLARFDPFVFITDSYINTMIEAVLNHPSFEKDSAGDFGVLESQDQGLAVKELFKLKNSLFFGYSNKEITRTLIARRIFESLFLLQSDMTALPSYTEFVLNKFCYPLFIQTLCVTEPEEIQNICKEVYANINEFLIDQLKQEQLSEDSLKLIEALLFPPTEEQREMNTRNGEAFRLSENIRNGVGNIEEQKTRLTCLLKEISLILGGRLKKVEEGITVLKDCHSPLSQALLEGFQRNQDSLKFQIEQTDKILRQVWATPSKTQI